MTTTTSEWIACKKMAAQAVEAAADRFDADRHVAEADALNATANDIRALSPTPPAPTQGEPRADRDGRCTCCGEEFEDPALLTHECAPGFTTGGGGQPADAAPCRHPLDTRRRQYRGIFCGICGSGPLPEATIPGQPVPTQGDLMETCRHCNGAGVSNANGDPCGTCNGQGGYPAATGGGGQPAEDDVLARARETVSAFDPGHPHYSCARALLAEVARREAAERDLTRVTATAEEARASAQRQATRAEAAERERDKWLEKYLATARRAERAEREEQRLTVSALGEAKRAISAEERAEAAEQRLRQMEAALTDVRDEIDSPSHRVEGDGYSAAIISEECENKIRAALEGRRTQGAPDAAR